MPEYRYTGEQERYYPARGLTVTTGDTAEWDEPPDIYWDPVDRPAPANPPAPPEKRGRSVSGDAA